jgi:hypothetical protein
MNNKPQTEAEQKIVTKNQIVLSLIFIVVGAIVFSIGLPLDLPVWGYFPSIATVSIISFWFYLKRIEVKK